MTKKTRKTASPDFETSLEALEALVERMESGEQSLEEAMQDFEKGVELTRQCQAALKNAELKIRLLLEKNGSESLEAFEDGAEAGQDGTSTDGK